MTIGSSTLARQTMSGHARSKTRGKHESWCESYLKVVPKQGAAALSDVADEPGEGKAHRGMEGHVRPQQLQLWGCQPPLTPWCQCASKHANNDSRLMQ